MENELSRVIDSLPGMVWTALPDGHVDFVNQRWSEYTGLSAEAAYGRGWQTTIHPQTCRSCSTAGNPFWHPASQVRWTRVSHAPMGSIAGSNSVFVP
jgi:PAS domain-containing protein